MNVKSTAITGLRISGHVAGAIARAVADEVRWWRDARQLRREYIGGLSNAEIDRRWRARE